MTKARWVLGAVVFPLLTTASGCGDDGNDGATEADRIGVGAECQVDDDCLQLDEEITTICLTQFGGGYCGLRGCAQDLDCPQGSACVLHDDGETYCFRICQDKSECNLNRPAEEANCSSNVEFTSEATSVKACVPPSSGM